MRHYLLPFFRPRLYRAGLKRVYRGDRNRAMIVHILWLAAPAAISIAFFLPRFVDASISYAATNSPDVDTSLPLVVLFLMGWIPAWHYSMRLGDRLFDRKVPWRRYGGGYPGIPRSSPISIERARRFPAKVSVKWEVLERCV